ncbi:DsrE/DsrF/DrsH-like family protein [archaeon]|nr:DsrE/DsrF/DrsH-like family protein [archaeon]
MTEIKKDETIDVRGKSCPMPVLKTKKAIDGLEDGQVVEVLATDKGSKSDIPAWASKTGNKVLEVVEEGDVIKFYVQKGTGEAPSEEAGAPKIRKKKLSIIMTKGTLDMAYIPFIVGNTAAAMGMDVSIFFTFYGFSVINKKKYKNLKVAPLANPAMPMPSPMDKIFSNAMGAVPGMTAIGTMMMKQMFKKGGVPPIEEMVDDAVKLGIKLLPCQMTMDVMGIKREDLIDGTEEPVGAAAYLADAIDSDINFLV